MSLQKVSWAAVHHAVGNAPAGGGFPAGHCVRPDLRQLYEYIVGDHLMRSEWSLLELERELDPRLFFRINKKYIVNFSYIESYDNGELSIRKEDESFPQKKGGV